ncbi:MAG: HAD hydrolase-like protein [Candidatus Marsarchaeota archaeon]|nr:HAD hydrolase-like protein [Candidatus Marsarchaeota archaeon]
MEKIAGQKIRTPAKPADNAVAGMLRDRKAAILDKDGVIVDISGLLHENMRRGFAFASGKGIACGKFNYSKETTYGLRGLSADYNGGILPIMALIAVSRFSASRENTAGLSADEILSGIISGKEGARKLGNMISKHTSQEDAATARLIYMWDSGSFFSSAGAAGYVKPIEGSREAILQLLDQHSGKVSILTNTPTRAAAERDLLTVFSRRELEQIHIIGGETVPAPKPSPLGAIALMERMRVSPEETYMVGDTPVDITTARNAKMASVGVLSGMGTREVLAHENPDVIADSLASFVSLLRGI